MLKRVTGTYPIEDEGVVLLKLFHGVLLLRCFRHLSAARVPAVVTSSSLATTTATTTEERIVKETEKKRTKILLLKSLTLMSKSVYVRVFHDLELLRYVLRCAIGRQL